MEQFDRSPLIVRCTGKSLPILDVTKMHRRVMDWSDDSEHTGFVVHVADSAHLRRSRLMELTT